MGGCCSGAGGSARHLAHDVSGITASSGGDGDGDSSDSGESEDVQKQKEASVVLPERMDGIWKVKAELVDQSASQVHSLPQQTFCARLGLQTRECFKALAAFQRCSDSKGRLRADKLCRMLDFPVHSGNGNRILSRVVACFDADASRSVDFREWLVLAAMHFGESISDLEKLRFWWWLMLFTDEDSVLIPTTDHRQSADDTTATRVGRQDAAAALTSGMKHDLTAPLESLGRLLRDCWASCHGLRISKDMEAFAYNQNPAPSKIYSKIMNLLLKKGKLKLGCKVSFGQFHKLCTKQHRQFYTILSYFFNQLAALLKSAPSPQPVKPEDTIKFKAYFHDKVGEYREIEKRGKNVARAREQSEISSCSSGTHAAPANAAKATRIQQLRAKTDTADAVGEAAPIPEEEESEPSDYSSSGPDPASDEDAPSGTGLGALFSPDESPAPRFKTYWEKLESSRSPERCNSIGTQVISPDEAMRFLEKEQKPGADAVLTNVHRQQKAWVQGKAVSERRRKHDSFLRETYQQELSRRVSELTAELERLDTGMQSLRSNSDDLLVLDHERLFRDPLSDVGKVGTNE